MDHQIIYIYVLVSRFLSTQKPHLAASSYAWYDGYLRPFADQFQRVDAAKLTVSAVQSWVARYPERSRYAAARSIKRVFNWAVDECILTSNPIRGYRKPPAPQRETSLTPAQYAACLRAARPALRAVIKFLWHTGARPQELRAIRAEWCQDSKIVFPLAASKGRRKRRVIYLDGMARRQAAYLRSRHRHSQIFRTPTGRPWTKHNLVKSFRLLRKEIGIDGLCAYSLRHSFITRLLEQGVDVATVAAIAGNSPRMVLNVYNHVARNEGRLLAVVSQTCAASFSINDT
jgi:integrase